MITLIPSKKDLLLLEIIKSYPAIEYFKVKGLVKQVSCLEFVDKVYAKTVKQIVS